MEALAGVAWGYVVGSLPFSFWLARWRGVDLRRSGSGNVGAANVLRTSGRASAALAIGFDAGKGAAAVLVTLAVASGSLTPVVAGVASIVGHIYPAWLGFRGGKGVATAAGVFVVLEPTAVAVAAVAFAAALAFTHYVSVGSIAGAVTLATTMVLLGSPAALVIAAAVSAALVIHRHRGNLGRLAAGTEHRLGDRL